MKYQITITLPGAEPVVQEVSHDWPQQLEIRVRRLQKRYPQADISWREVSDARA